MIVRFEPFQADLADERLWRSAEPVRLTRKAWAVLRVLLGANGRLVTKEELADSVWGGTHVGDDSLTKVVRELRRALADDQRAPRFIATVHGRGYRFIAPLDADGRSVSGSTSAPAATLIGREHELGILQGWFAMARQGRRQVGFVSGELGIGKSSVIAAFLAGAERDGGALVQIAAGPCVEQYGEAEPFLPVIAALRQLARTLSAAAILRRVAPSWLVSACGLGAVRGGTDAPVGSRTGVLRILAEVIEALAEEAPLALVLEDLHWSDPSTLDLINLLARRTDAARLFVLGTLRLSDALVSAHPAAQLVRELRRTERGRELALAPLTLPDVGHYLAARLDAAPPPDAAGYLLRHTGANPFFLGTLIDDLLARGALRRAGERWVLDADATPTIPSRSLAALTPRLERLDPAERPILEAASVVGDVFSAERIAAALSDASAPGPALEEIETVCERLVRHHAILRRGDDRARYAFQHALYRQALYDGIPPARRRRIHARVGELLARARPAAAAELAEHFARAGDHVRAASYHAEAALAAQAHCAHREAAAHLSAALTHIGQCPPSTDRDLQELMLVRQRAATTMALEGFGDPVVVDDCQRARDLARRLQIPLAEFLTTAGLVFLHLMRAELDAAAALADELTVAAPALPLPECAAAATAATGVLLFSRGQLLAARQRLEAVRGQFPRRQPGFAFDSTVWHLAVLAMLYADLGEAHACRTTTAELLATAADGPAADRANAHMLVASIEAQLRDPVRTLEHVGVAIDIADDASLLVASAGQLRGWALAALGDLAGARLAYDDRGAVWAAIGQRLGLPLLAMLRAEGALCAGDLEIAEASIRVGLIHADATGERRYDSELYRLRAECMRRRGYADAASLALQRALAIAAEQGARLAELRAAIDNVDLHRSTSGSAAAAQRLATVADSFDPDEPLAELSAASDLLRSNSSAA